MDSKIFYYKECGDAVYRTFYEEFKEYCNNNGILYWYFSKDRNEFAKFLETKDIGLRFDDFSITGGYCSYTIIDEKKFVLSKIKYGF